MLTKVEVQNPKGAILPLELGDISGGYLVKDVEGLDPVKAQIVTSSFAQMDGEQYQTSRRESRNIKLKLGLEPDFAMATVRSLRDRLYQFFMPKSEVTLRIYEDDRYVSYISGQVEEFVNPRFTQDPEIDISIMCFDPDFVAPLSAVVSGNTVADTAEQRLSYPGTVEAGLSFKMTVNRVLAEFSITNRLPSSESQLFEFDAPLQVADVIEVNTQPGNKGVYLTRNGVRATYLYGMAPISRWITLYPGDNFFRVQASGAAIRWDLEYTAKYGAL